MQLLPFLLFFAASLRAAPTKVASTLDLTSFTGSEPALDQGDGFYIAEFNASGIAEVEYTPWDDLAKLPAPVKSPAPAKSKRSSSDALDSTIQKRDTFCSTRTSINTPELDEANRQLATNAKNREYQRNSWGWVSDSLLSDEAHHNDVRRDC